MYIKFEAICIGMGHNSMTHLLKPLPWMVWCLGSCIVVLAGFTALQCLLKVYNPICCAGWNCQQHELLTLTKLSSSELWCYMPWFTLKIHIHFITLFLMNIIQICIICIRKSKYTEWLSINTHRYNQVTLHNLILHPISDLIYIVLVLYPQYLLNIVWANII